LAEGLGLASDAQESKEKDLTDESAEKDVKTSENMSLEGCLVIILVYIN